VTGALSARTNRRRATTMEIQGAKVLVTGAASGMGRTFTLELAKAGADVAACDLNVEGLAQTEALAKGLPGRVTGLEADVSKEEQVVDLIKRAAEALGGLNVLVNNAGLFKDGLLVKVDKDTGEIKKMPLANWQKVIDVDLTGPFLCTREFAAHCIQSKTPSAVVVNISSIARYGNPGQTNYSAAKAGLVADTDLWAKELARYGIRTGAIAPGFVDTPILQGMRPEVLEGMLKPVPLRRVAKPEEIYLAVKFIIECDYFTGRCIDIDGGMRIG
jgi:3-oxoacyl-[acyl-carrier protein] reductase